jgi:hypothetical protein
MTRSAFAQLHLEAPKKRELKLPLPPSVLAMVGNKTFPPNYAHKHKFKNKNKKIIIKRSQSSTFYW